MLKITAALVALALATPAFAACGMPEIAKPIVPYEIYPVPPATLAASCPGAAFSCAYPAPTWFQPKRWAIVINQDLSDADKICSLVYEKGRLPPNYWRRSAPADQVPAAASAGPVA